MAVAATNSCNSNKSTNNNDNGRSNNGNSSTSSNNSNNNNNNNNNSTSKNKALCVFIKTSSAFLALNSLLEAPANMDTAVQKIILLKAQIYVWPATLFQD